MKKILCFLCIVLPHSLLANNEKEKFYIHIFNCEIPIYGESYTLLTSQKEYKLYNKSGGKVIVRDYDDSFEQMGKKTGELFGIENTISGLTVKTYTITHINENEIDPTSITLITDRKKVISFFGEEGKSWERKLEYCEQSKLKN